MAESAPTERTIGELRASGWATRSLREELRSNLVARIHRDLPRFTHGGRAGGNGVYSWSILAEYIY